MYKEILSGYVYTYSKVWVKKSPYRNPILQRKKNAKQRQTRTPDIIRHLLLPWTNSSLVLRWPFPPCTATSPGRISKKATQLLYFLQRPEQAQTLQLMEMPHSNQKAHMPHIRMRTDSPTVLKVSLEKSKIAAWMGQLPLSGPLLFLLLALYPGPAWHEWTSFALHNSRAPFSRGSRVVLPRPGCSLC